MIKFDGNRLVIPRAAREIDPARNVIQFAPALEIAANPCSTPGRLSLKRRIKCCSRRVQARQQHQTDREKPNGISPNTSATLPHMMGSSSAPPKPEPIWR